MRGPAQHRNVTEGLILDPGGPIALSEAWIGSRVIAHDLDGDDLADVLQQNGDASAWAIAPREETSELLQLAKILGLDEAAVTELLSPEHRCQVSEYGDCRLVRLLAVELAERELTVADLSMIIADQVVIILVDEGYGRQIARMLDASGPRSGPGLTQGGADWAAQLVVDFVINTMINSIDQLETAGDDLADELFGGHPLTKQRKLDVFRLRRAVTQLRRVSAPTRDVVQELADVPGSDELGIRNWNKIIERTERVELSVVTLADGLTAIFETSLSLDNARLDDVLKRLAGWGAIIAVPILITGFVGMNVSFWLSGTAVGFYVYLALILVAAIALYVVFRRKSWI